MIAVLGHMNNTSSKTAIYAPGGMRPSSSDWRLGLARTRSPALSSPAKRLRRYADTEPNHRSAANSSFALSATSIFKSYSKLNRTKVHTHRTEYSFVFFFN